MNHMDFELYIAVICGNNEVLKEIEGRFSVDDQLKPTKFTVLHLAFQYGNITCVEEILTSHESLLLKLNSRDETALHLAARGEHYDVSKALAKSSLLQTRSSTVAEFLIRTANVEFETALHEAVRYNHLNVVELLVTEDPSHPHSPNKHDETPLYLASLGGYKDIIKMILDKCIPPTYGGPDGKTALRAAILDDGIECVKLLSKKRKELIKVAHDNGWTAYHYAAYKVDYIVIEDLVDSDESVAYLADKKYKRTPLHVAAYVGRASVMWALLTYCPDSCDIIDGSGRKILHIAVERKHKNIIRYISIKCKEINNLLIQKDKRGNTPLHLMAMLGCYVPEVMDHKQVDWEALNGQNLTPVDVISSSSEYLPNQEKMMRMHANDKRHWNLDITLKEPDYDNVKTLASIIDQNKERAQYYRKMKMPIV